MKKRIRLSRYCIFVTTSVIALPAFACLLPHWYVYMSICIAPIIVCLFFWPISIEAGESDVIIHRAIGKTIIPYKQIEMVEPFTPSAGSIRILGSGGFLGYWGKFHDSLIGNYIGYWGKNDESFLIKITNGKQYVVSCENHKEMIAYLKNKI